MSPKKFETENVSFDKTFIQDLPRLLKRIPRGITQTKPVPRSVAHVAIFELITGTASINPRWHC